MESDWEKTDKRVRERKYKTEKTRLINKKKKKKNSRQIIEKRRVKGDGGWGERGGEMDDEGLNP